MNNTDFNKQINTKSELKSAIEYITDTLTHDIQKNNISALKTILKSNEVTNIFVTAYTAGHTIVKNGYIADERIKNNEMLSYSTVPLGLIISGSITVMKNGHGMKKLSTGDFIGLFETSDFLLHSQKRTIGNWSLITEAEVSIIYFGIELLLQSGAEYFREYLVSCSRKDTVPQPITELSLLDWVARHTTKSRQKDCAIIVHTHLLPNNKPLFRHLSSLLDFGHIYVLDKPYSTVKSTYNDLIWAGFEVIPVRMEYGLPYEFATDKSVEVLWRKVIEDHGKMGFKKLLIIDDGGEIWRSIPTEQLGTIQIAVVEQTQRGIARVENSTLKHPPIVSVASSGIKKIVESRFIGKSVITTLQDLNIIQETYKIGIIGMGSIGLAIQSYLHTLGIQVFSYDPAYNKAINYTEFKKLSLDSLINDCDLIIGTTGTDCLKGLPFERIHSGTKILVSTSSADIEFSSLLKLSQPNDDPFGTITIQTTKDLEFNILNGGYPINFNRIKDSTPDEDIVLTRCLMYIGAMQALELMHSNVSDSVVYNLDKISQEKLLREWILYKESVAQDPEIIENEIETIIQYSSSPNALEMSSVWSE